MLRRLVGAWPLVAAIAPAAAGVELGALSPRAVGHAGASLVSDDGVAATFACPAAIARRDVRRAQLSGLVVDDEATLATPDHPAVGDGSGATVAPTVGALGHLGELVLAVAFATTERFDRELPVPALELPVTEIEARFPHRYAGTTATWERQSLAAAVAWRPTEWLAVGASLSLSRVDITERRRLWAGFAGRDPLASPGRDVDLTVAAGDGLVPGAVIGALVAPLDAPLELALGVAWSDDARVDGDVVAVAAPGAATVVGSAPRAAARFGSALTTRVGARWLAERYAIEGEATWIAYPTGDDPWVIDGLAVVDQSGARAEIAGLASRLPRRDHGGLAVAADLELVPAFAWLSLGYRWSFAASPASTVTTVGAELGGHTLAAGVELSAGDAIITIGVARQLARARAVTSPVLPLDNPFPGGTAPANLGLHSASLDLIGIGLELAAP